MTEMATEMVPQTTTNIVALVEATPVIVLTDKQKFSAFYEAMKAECDALEPDLSSERGRKAIASMAYKVARTKTAIDDAGKKLNEEARDRINAVDAARRAIRDQLDALKDDVRQPLTEWEDAEKARADKAEQTIVLLRDSAKIGFDETASDLRKRVATLAAMPFDPEVLRGYAAQAEALRNGAVAGLTSAADRMDQEESQRAELERLRAEAAQREEEDRIKREAEEAARHREAAEKAEAEAKARAEAEQKAREAAAVKAAEERARQEAEAKAHAERESADRAHRDALNDERRRADEAESAAAAERQRIADEVATRKAAKELADAEQAAREADRAHRGKIMGEAKDAIIEAGPVGEDVARAIVLAIAAGGVPNISIRF